MKKPSNTQTMIVLQGNDDPIRLDDSFESFEAGIRRVSKRPPIEGGAQWGVVYIKGTKTILNINHVSLAFAVNKEEE